MSVSCSYIKDGFEVSHLLKNKHITECSVCTFGGIKSLLSLLIWKWLLLPQVGMKSVGREDSREGNGCETNHWGCETLETNPEAGDWKMFQSGQVLG